MSDAETILRHLLERIVRELAYKEADVSIRALTSGGANFTSTLYAATVAAPDHATLKLFAKVANINEKLRTVMKVGTMFKTENFFYTNLAGVYKRLLEIHEVPAEDTFVFPKFYGSNTKEREETVVLEDLVAEGYAPHSRFKSIDWEHFATTVEALAKFHALSFAYKKDDPENFNRTLEKVTIEVPRPSDDPIMKETWVKMVEGAVQVVKEDYKEKLRKFLREDSTLEDFYKYRQPLKTPVISHGDYRVSNLLFKRRDGKLEAIVVDYQTLHSGSPATDLLYLEFMGTDQEFRRENHGRLLDYYHQQLGRMLDRLGVDVNEVFPREAFDMEVKEMLPHVLRISATLLSFVLVEAERAPTMGGDSDVQDFVISPNELFAQRFSGIVDDCVKWGAL